jgi:hypothetical protein
MTIQQLTDELATLETARTAMFQARDAIAAAQLTADEAAANLQNATQQFLADVTAYFAELSSRFKQTAGNATGANGEIINALSALLEKIMPFIMQILPLFFPVKPTTSSKKR